MDNIPYDTKYRLLLKIAFRFLLSHICTPVLQCSLLPKNYSNWQKSKRMKTICYWNKHALENHWSCRLPVKYMTFIRGLPTFCTFSWNRTWNCRKLTAMKLIRGEDWKAFLVLKNHKDINSWRIFKTSVLDQGEGQKISEKFLYCFIAIFFIVLVICITCALFLQFLFSSGRDQWI